MNTTDYGFIGVGRMGAHMARRLLKAGFSLTVYDTSKDAVEELVKAGAQAAGSALEVANTTERAFLSLPTPDIVTKVCEGLTAAKKLKVVADCSTTGPGGARIAHATLAKANATAPAAMSEGTNQKLERNRSQYLSTSAFTISHPTRRTAHALAEIPRPARVHSD